MKVAFVVLQGAIYPAYSFHNMQVLNCRDDHVVDSGKSILQAGDLMFPVHP